MRARGEAGRSIRKQRKKGEYGTSRAADVPVPGPCVPFPCPSSTRKEKELVLEREFEREFEVSC